MKKTISLNENYLFRRAYNKGKAYARSTVAVYILKSGKKFNRLGITTSKKIGGAVQRNRARRVIKEAYRLLGEDLPGGYNIVVVARKKAVICKMQAVKNDLDSIFKEYFKSL